MESIFYLVCVLAVSRGIFWLYEPVLARVISRQARLGRVQSLLLLLGMLLLLIAAGGVFLYAPVPAFIGLCLATVGIIGYGVYLRVRKTG